MVDEIIPVKRKRGNPNMIKGGKALNPGGKPKQPKEMTQLAKDKSMDAMLTLVKIMEDDKARNIDRIAAAKEIMNRGYGTPIAHVESTNENNNTVVVTMSEELQKYAK